MQLRDEGCYKAESAILRGRRSIPELAVDTVWKAQLLIFTTIPSGFFRTLLQKVEIFSQVASNKAGRSVGNSRFRITKMSP
jgi:hypothetical protein